VNDLRPTELTVARRTVTIGVEVSQQPRSQPAIIRGDSLGNDSTRKEVLNGWTSSARIEELRAAWLDAADFEQQKRICIALQKQLWIDVPFIPMGEYWQATAYRKDLTNVLPGCFTAFYAVRRA
jgi:ABC-type transport system substrate-binding protein